MALKEYPYTDQSSKFDYPIKHSYTSLGISNTIVDEIEYLLNRSSIVCVSITILTVSCLVNTLTRYI